MPHTSRRRCCGFPASAALLVACCAVAAFWQTAGCDRAASRQASKTGNPKSGEAAVSNRLSVGLSKKILAGEQRLPNETAAPRFVEAEREAGLQFTYANGAAGKWLMTETTGGGAGWVDFDRDGRYDVYFAQAGPIEAPVDKRTSANRLFQNRIGGRFDDVTDAAGVGDLGYGQGIAVGDFDNDGFDDLYVTNVGRNALYRNNGDGTFRDVTLSAGVGDPHWSTSAAWGDIDQDGDLDLFVCNYVKFDPRNPKLCKRHDGSPATCHPEQFAGEPNECFLNLGDGTFRPAASERGLRGPHSKSLGVVIADLTADGRPDIFVANDTTANFLFVNRGNGRFVESAGNAGCAMNAAGSYQASMGVALGDYDDNGHLDLYVTHFTDDSNTLYTNLGPVGFQDTTHKLGLHQPTKRYLAFGTVMADFNQDGRMELFIVNGHVDDWRYRGEMWHMPDQLFTFADNRWWDVGPRAGDYFRKKQIGRGVAMADYDGDGDLDLVVVQQNAPVTLLKNASRRGHWLNVELVGRSSNRRGIGARVSVRQNGKERVAELAGGTSYCSSHQHAAHFGLGASDRPCAITIRWPSGILQKLDPVKVDQTLVLTEPDQ